jgi:peptidyl-prolyl cis-trans isomerase D
MLRILREHATSWMLRGILILVAVTFISWGGYSLIREKKVTYAAKVNGVEIDMKEYHEAFQGVLKQYRDALGPSFSEKMAEELRIREKVLDDLIARVLILEEGTRLGIKVYDEELREAIESISAFQVENQFDRRLYERFLRMNRMSAEDFERMQRQSLLLTKAVGLIKSNGGKVSEGELLETYLLENERINLAFLKISPDAFRGQVDVNEVEIKDYYEKRQEEFRTPTLLQVQYLLFRLSDYEGKVEVSSDEIKRAYDLQKDRYRTPQRARAREILIRVSPEDPSEKVEEKRTKAEEILEKAKKSKDFPSLAKQVSESNTASRGGEIGWVQRGMVEEAIEKALFSLKAGEVSNLVRARNGFYIFKMEEMVPEKIRTLEEVKDSILQALKREKANREASRRADDAFYSLFRSRDLEGFAREKNIPVRTTRFFKEGDEVPEIGKNPAFYSAASALKVGEISPVVSIPPNLCILKLTDKKESRIPSFEEVKEEARKKVFDMKSDEKARRAAEELLGQVRAGKAVREIAKGKGLPVEETGFFTRTAGVIPKIGPAQEWMPTLASLTEKNPAPREPLRTKEGYFVVRVQALEPADQGKFEGVRKNLERRLIYQKQEELFQSWLEGLKANAEIEKNKDLL